MAPSGSRARPDVLAALAHVQVLAVPGLPPALIHADDAWPNLVADAVSRGAMAAISPAMLAALGLLADRHSGSGRIGRMPPGLTLPRTPVLPQPRPHPPPPHPSDWSALPGGSAAAP